MKTYFLTFLICQGISTNLGILLKKIVNLVYVKIQFEPDTEQNMLQLKKSFAEFCNNKHSFNRRIIRNT